MKKGFEVEIPEVYYKWKMAEKYGWTLDYIDGLTVGQMNEYLQILDAESRIGSSILG